MQPRIIDSEGWSRLKAATERVGDEQSRIRREATGIFIKIFPRRDDSLSEVRAHAANFVTNCRRLAELGFATPEVLELVWVAEEFAYVRYHPLIGDSLRDLITADGTRCLDRLPAFFDRLHRAGVYFRAAHLGNLLRLDDVTDEKVRGFGLIDVANVRYQDEPLGPVKRARNLLHLLNHRIDHEAMRAYGYQRFLRDYYIAAQLGPLDRAALKARLRWSLGRF